MKGKWSGSQEGGDVPITSSLVDPSEPGGSRDLFLPEAPSACFWKVLGGQDDKLCKRGNTYKYRVAYPATVFVIIRMKQGTFSLLPLLWQQQFLFTGPREREKQICYLSSVHLSALSLWERVSEWSFACHLPVTPQQLAAVEGWLRHLKVDQWVGTSWGIIHLTCRIQMGFWSLFAQKSKISVSIAMEGRESETGAEVRVGWKRWPLFHDHGGSCSPAPLFSRPDL